MKAALIYAYDAGEFEMKLNGKIREIENAGGMELAIQYQVVDFTQYPSTAGSLGGGSNRQDKFCFTALITYK